MTSVALKGGTSQAPDLNRFRRRLAAADSGRFSRGRSQHHGPRALRRLDGILAENSDALRGTFSNLSTFTGALARNSDRIDGIVAGLQRMTGGGDKAQTLSFDLTAPEIAADGKSESGPSLLQNQPR